MKRLLVLWLVLNAPVWAEDLPTADGLYARFDTSRGLFVVRLEPDAAPLATALFVGLAEGALNPTNPGQPFYRSQVFHAASADAVQGGDPTGTGQSAVGGPVPTEAGLPYDQPGVLSLFNAAADRNASQFFLTLRAWPELRGHYPGFGRVVSGLAVVKALKKGDTLTLVTIVRQGTAALAFKADRAALDGLLAARQAQRDAALLKAAEGATVTASGLKYVVLRPGTGAKPKKGQTVTADYEGRLIDGTIFDSSYTKKTPFQFSVGTGNVIAAWDEALLDMRVGEKRRLVVPPGLGYGAQGAPPNIPPNSWLIFEVELVGIRG